MEDNNLSFHKKAVELFEIYNEYISNWYEYYMDCFEIFMEYLGHGVSSFNKTKDVNTETFNAFMTGYQKARTDLGLGTINDDNKISEKDPSDIYF